MPSVKIDFHHYLYTATATIIIYQKRRQIYWEKTDRLDGFVFEERERVRERERELWMRAKACDKNQLNNSRNEFLHHWAGAIF